MKTRLLLWVLLLAAWATPVHALTASCRWFAPTKYVDGSTVLPGTMLRYTVYRSTRSDLADAVALGVTDQLFFYDSTARRKTSYWYYVTAYVVVGKEGPASTIARFYSTRP